MEFVAKFELLENLVSQWSSNSTVAHVPLVNVKSEFNLGLTTMETLDSLVDPGGSDSVMGTSDNLEPFSDVISSPVPVISKPINSWPVVFQSNDSRLTKRRKFPSKSTAAVMKKTKRKRRKLKNSVNLEEPDAAELEKTVNVVQESVINSIIEGEPIPAAEPAVPNDIFCLSSDLTEHVPKKRIVSILKTRKLDLDDSICYICMKRKPDSLQEKTRSVSWVACAERCGRLVHKQCLLQGFNICKFCYDEAVACYKEMD